jgi:hypothetical protein
LLTDQFRQEKLDGCITLTPFLKRLLPYRYGDCHRTPRATNAATRRARFFPVLGFCADSFIGFGHFRFPRVFKAFR